MKLYVLYLGDACTYYRSLAPGVDDNRRIHVPIRSLLIETDDGQAVVIDTGNPRASINSPTATNMQTRFSGKTLRSSTRLSRLHVTMRPEDFLLRRLANLDVGPGDVKHLINTHFHSDHAGNNDLFPGATCYAQRGHLEDALDNPAFPAEFWKIPSINYQPVDGTEEILPGVTLVHTPGHVPFHQSVIIDLPHTGRVVVCGDAIFCEDQLKHEAWSNHKDPELAKSTAHMLQSLIADRPGFLLFGHDPAQNQVLKAPPFYYD